MPNPTKLLLVLPSLSSGGMERVMSQLAWYFTARPQVEVSMLIMTRSEKFYKLPESIPIYEPDFDHQQYSRLVFTWKIFRFVQKKLRELQPDALLSFGGKYNAFVLLAARGLNIRTFISDRSRPTISYGRLQDRLNPLVYRTATGIIAQTDRAREVIGQQTRHSNITVIGNPIRHIKPVPVAREKIILSVGRFITSKKQDWLIDYFESLALPDWQLLFLGEGPHWERVKSYAAGKACSERIHFAGNVREIDQYYRRASVFAFPTLSEGFPNALGEAMQAGMACVSFDCEAGPGDLISDGENGFLVPEADHDKFRARLQQLCEDEALRVRFGTAAEKTLARYHPDNIGLQFEQFIIPQQT